MSLIALSKANKSDWTARIESEPWVEVILTD